MGVAHTLQVVLEIVAQAIGMFFVHVGDDALLDGIVGGSHGAVVLSKYSSCYTGILQTEVVGD